MFTGLIEETGQVRSIRKRGDGISLEIGAALVIDGSKTGDSISINGACQTVTDIGNDGFTVFVSRITFTTTTLGGFTRGMSVNLERAMLPSSRFGGHFVQGHVDGKGRISGKKTDANGIEIRVDIDKGLGRYVAGKGSITLDGISLTVVALTDTGFIVYIIPETMNKTTALNWSEGDNVNVEVDILAKYMERIVNSGSSGSGDDMKLKSKLADEGFL